MSIGLLAGACAGLLDLSSALSAAPASADDTGSDVALILGHAFLPTPDASYIQQVMDTYIDPTPAYFSGQPVYSGYSPVGVTTPETDYDSGLTQGVADLNQAINQQLADGNNAVVFGYSMSPSVETQEMINLDALGADAPSPDHLSFILAEDLNNPDGGIFTRFPGIGGVTLPATPADTPYTTDIYTIEYSGASDFPQYSSDMLADANAADGYLDLHPYLLPGWPAYFSPTELAGAVPEPTSGADVATDYFMIPTQELPLLEGLHVGTGAGSAYADLIQPDMRVLVDLGYNWTGDADVDTPAVSTSPDIDTTAVDAYLAAGADQGMIAALVDLGILPQTDLSTLYPYVPDVAGLEAGALTSDTTATADASASSAALLSDLAASTNPLAAELSGYLPGAATELADMFANSVNFLFF
ncbi:MAG: PE-PPE domain-containing protein [Mycobacterium sp.]|nr:PE-PPE domain-containing protein [Mycobacterium sp.]